MPACNHVFDWGNCTSNPPFLPPPTVPPYCGCPRPGTTVPNVLDPSVGPAILDLQGALRNAFMGVSLSIISSFVRIENPTDSDISNPKPGSQPFTLVQAEVRVTGNLNALAFKVIEDVAAFYVSEQLGGQIPNDKPVRYDLTLVYINPRPTP